LPSGSRKTFEDPGEKHEPFLLNARSVPVVRRTFRDGSVAAGDE
jgi:hypothetical protein